MLIAEISNPVPVYYKEAFPNTSFPSSGPTDSFLTGAGWAKVNLTKSYNPATQKLVQVSPYFEFPWIYTVTVVDKTEAEIAEEQAAADAKQAASVRADRNSRLAACDWTQVADAPVDKTTWAAYRQSLRDISAQPGFPWTIDWPVAPG